MGSHSPPRPRHWRPTTGTSWPARCCAASWTRSCWSAPSMPTRIRATWSSPGTAAWRCLTAAPSAGWTGGNEARCRRCLPPSPPRTPRGSATPCGPSPPPATASTSCCWSGRWATCSPTSSAPARPPLAAGHGVLLRPAPDQGASQPGLPVVHGVRRHAPCGSCWPASLAPRRPPTGRGLHRPGRQPAELVDRYASRWSVEVCFEQSRQIVGVDGPDRVPRFGRQLLRETRLTRAGTRAAPLQSHSNATGGNMAALFLVLAVVDAVLLGDAVLANTSASSVSVFDQSITGFTQGQLLLLAAGLGLLCALLLGLALSSSGARRAKRRRLRAARRDLEGRVAELERENATLRQEQERFGRLAELRGEASSEAQAQAQGRARERASQPPVDAHA